MECSQWRLKRNFGILYRKELKGASNILVLLYANVTSIIANDSAAVADIVEFQVLTGKQETAGTHVYVICLRYRNNPLVDFFGPYGYHPASHSALWNDEASKHNETVAGSRWHLYTIEDATHLLGASGLRLNPNRNRQTARRLLRRRGKFSGLVCSTGLDQFERLLDS